MEMKNSLVGLVGGAVLYGATLLGGFDSNEYVKRFSPSEEISQEVSYKPGGCTEPKIPFGPRGPGPGQEEPREPRFPIIACPLGVPAPLAPLVPSPTPAPIPPFVPTPPYKPGKITAMDFKKGEYEMEINKPYANPDSGLDGDLYAKVEGCLEIKIGEVKIKICTGSG